MAKKVNESDRQKLYNLTKHPGYKVLEAGCKNLIKSVHLGMEMEDEEKVLFRNQGYIMGVKDVLAVVKKEVERLKKEEENEKIEEETITDE